MVPLGGVTPGLVDCTVSKAPTYLYRHHAFCPGPGAAPSSPSVAEPGATMRRRRRRLGQELGSRTQSWLCCLLLSGRGRGVLVGPRPPAPQDATRDRKTLWTALRPSSSPSDQLHGCGTFLCPWAQSPPPRGLTIATSLSLCGRRTERKGRRPHWARLSPPSTRGQAPWCGLRGRREDLGPRAGPGAALQVWAACVSGASSPQLCSTGGGNGWVTSASRVPHPEEHCAQDGTCLWTTGRDRGKPAASGPAVCQGALTPTFHRATARFQ